jgi:small subunit ribosomal protein S3Ae
MVKGAKKGGRVRDKWRDKQWVVVNSPSAFGSTPLNYIPITDRDGAIGRVVENTVYDIMKQDMTQHQIKIFVQIDRINDSVASTIFKGHEYAKEFLRSLVRRGSTKVTYIDEYTTMDGHTFRVMFIAFTERRINSSKKHAIRMIAHQVLSERIPKLAVDPFAQEVVLGKIAADILAEARKITPLRHAGIEKTKLISTPLSRAIKEAKPVEVPPLNLNNERIISN